MRRDEEKGVKDGDYGSASFYTGYMNTMGREREV